MRTAWKDNHILLRGRAAEAPRFSHRNHGTLFWLFPMTVRRLSGTEDRLNILTPGTLLDAFSPAPGEGAAVEGEVRSFNDRSGQGSRLVITVHARTLEPWSGEDGNEALLTGTLCRPPTLRRTPLGREICDMMLAVDRRYGRADYLPCIAWGAQGRQCAGLGVGDRVSLRGRLQSRGYVKQLPEGPQRRTAFEVSVMELLDSEERRRGAEG